MVENLVSTGEIRFKPAVKNNKKNKDSVKMIKTGKKIKLTLYFTKFFCVMNEIQ